jgi:hypothetical protein
MYGFLSGAEEVVARTQQVEPDSQPTGRMPRAGTIGFQVVALYLYRRSGDGVSEIT